MFLVFLLAASLTTRSAFLQRELQVRGFTKVEAKKLLNEPKLRLPLREVKREKISWEELRSRVLSAESIERGKAFLHDQEKLLRVIEAKFAVEKEVLVALLRTETDFGKNGGEYEVYKLFYRRAIAPRYAQWRSAARNFAALAAYCREAPRDCFDIRGSHEGAIGQPQFLPYSLEHYAVDWNKDGKIDLDDQADALASAANFLSAHNWRKSWGKALTRYYGSGKHYPKLLLDYAQALGLNLSEDPTGQRAKPIGKRKYQRKTKRPAKAKPRQAALFVFTIFSRQLWYSSSEAPQ